MKINLTTDEKVFDECAEIMNASEPWITLNRNLENCKEAMRGNNKEIYVLTENRILIGFAVIQINGTFKGYIQSILIKEQHRGKGFGSMLIEYCEKRIFEISPNIFMCVSAFNTNAEKLYYKLGFEKIGELKNFIVYGETEILLRKTIGPISEFQPK